MFRRHVIGQLSAHQDGELSAAESVRIEAHLRKCLKCRTADDEIRFGARLASTLNMSRTPDSAWRELQAVSNASARRRWILQTVLGGVFVVAVALSVVVWTRNHIPTGVAWEVTGLPGTSRLRPGQALQTDSSSAAQIKIANIGQLTIDPNTRIRLLVTQPDQHRIALDHGKLEATTWAPPRLFIVDTPAASAVDLGCKYTLQVEEDGSSLLHVTLGLVALARDGRETIVPAGAFCRTRPGTGPGTPFFDDSSAQFQSALDRVDFLTEGPERTQQVAVLLRESRLRDALSLWHLFPRVDEQSRRLIYDRLAQLLPPPPEVTREGIVSLNPDMLEKWRKIVAQLWQ